MISLANLLSHRCFKSCINNDAVYSFINSMIEESKYCSDTIPKYFNKELAMTKNIDEDFEDSTKYWICWISTKYWIQSKRYCHINEKCRSLAHGESNVDVKLNNKILVVFQK